jgi:hypothetical protein
MSPECAQALEDIRSAGRALLKYISPNDVDVTGAHQSGFYLPKGASKAFTPYPPEKNVNRDHHVRVTWPDGRETESVVKWYGQGTRSEYRLTRFGRAFPWRSPGRLGDLLILIPVTLTVFRAHILRSEDDIDDLQSGLGIEVIQQWVFYDGRSVPAESADQCLNRRFRAFVAQIEALPGVQVFSDATREALAKCIPDFTGKSPDERILRLVQEEYTLYRMAEQRIWKPRIKDPFRSIDEFLTTAQSILQARKSRAGRSLENHVEGVLADGGLPFQMRQVLDGTRPDIVIPGKTSYDNPEYPVEKLLIMGVKHTCKDRWRQVLKEAPRVRHRYIFTVQHGISSLQLDEMFGAGVSLIVPFALHKEYPRTHRKRLLTLQAFIEQAKHAIAQ